MQLQELLEHVNAEVLQDRAAVASGPTKVLWSDKVQVRYFNQAEQMFARRTYCLIDDTTAATCSIDLVAGTSAYALHASILKVYAARMSDTELDLPRSNHAQVQQSMSATLSNGRPLTWTTDHASRTLYVYPPPDTDAAALTLKLRVARMPIVSLSLTALTAEPEIPDEFHLDLCDWVAYKALTHQDVDGNNRKEATAFRAEFMRAIKDARLDTKRLMEMDGAYNFGGWGNG